MLSVAITTHNRWEMTWELIQNLFIANGKAGYLLFKEVVVCDDCSDDGSYEKLQKLIYPPLSNYTKLWGCHINMGMAKNKRRAVIMCDTDWVALLDSDNSFSIDYFSAIPETLSPDTIYMPVKANPNFDYSEFKNILFDKDTIKPYIGKGFFGALLNTCNYVVHKDTYVKNWRENREIKETDTIWHIYNHLKNGGKFIVVNGMEYGHLVHENSGFMKNVHYNMAKAVQLEKLILEL